jgi:hypothetical protein
MNHELDAELVELEQALRRSAAALPAALEGRTLAAMRRELSAQAHRRRNGFWGFAAAAAAVMLVGMNFIMAATRPQHAGPPALDPRQVQAVYEDIRRALPELGEAEAARQSVLLVAAAGLPPAAPLPPPTTRAQLKELLENGHGIPPVLD